MATSVAVPTPRLEHFPFVRTGRPDRSIRKWIVSIWRTDTWCFEFLKMAHSESYKCAKFWRNSRKWHINCRSNWCIPFEISDWTGQPVLANGNRPQHPRNQRTISIRVIYSQCFPRYHALTNSLYINHLQPTFSLFTQVNARANARNVSTPCSLRWTNYLDNSFEKRNHHLFTNVYLNPLWSQVWFSS